MIADITLPDGTRVVSDASWKVHTGDDVGWMDIGFDDSAWVPATAHAVYGDKPWSTRVTGFPGDSTAQWIWSADQNGDNVAYFRYHILVE
jgi:hypothetical protein